MVLNAQRLEELRQINVYWSARSKMAKSSIKSWEILDWISLKTNLKKSIFRKLWIINPPTSQCNHPCSQEKKRNNKCQSLHLNFTHNLDVIRIFINLFCIYNQFEYFITDNHPSSSMTFTLSDLLMFLSYCYQTSIKRYFYRSHFIRFISH